MKLIPSIPQETDDVTSDFDNIVENAKDCGILFILLLGHARTVCLSQTTRYSYSVGYLKIIHLLKSDQFLSFSDRLDSNFPFTKRFRKILFLHKVMESHFARNY